MKIKGPENTPYEGGYYHGKLVFPREFPFKPPAIYMVYNFINTIIIINTINSTYQFFIETFRLRQMVDLKLIKSKKFEF